MLFRSLFAKLTAVLMLLFCLVGVLLLGVTLLSAKMYHQEVNQKLNRELAKHIATQTPLLQERKPNTSALKQLFHTLMIFNPSIELYLLDKTGAILAYSAPPGSVKRSKIDLDPVQRYLKGKGRFPIVGDDPRSLYREKAFSAAFLHDKGQIQGYLYVILSSEQYDNAVELVQGSYILKSSFLIAAIGLVFSLLVGMVMFAWFTGRFRVLAQAMKDFKHGVAPETIALPSYKRNGDEIDQLTVSFCDMAKTINDQMEDLQTNDNLRRELVANVSHDLRTPLATLQGYIETLLLKDPQLDAAERRRFLEIAIQHCLRLNKLVNELFELAKLDAKETTPAKEPFNLPELVQDVLQEFQLTAKENNVLLSETAENALLPFVYADVSLIERVLENLIENALRHTSEGGSVETVLRQEEDHIVVQVNDTGHGIPKDQLPFIFDRFYQLEKSCGEQNANSGLGLAITKRIIELHNMNIGVTSEINKGTSISFNLPVHETQS